jgi:hypothetical protein
VQIGIGLPNPVPNIPGDLLVDWAQWAEAAGFSGLVTIDRIAYPGEPLSARSQSARLGSWKGLHTSSCRTAVSVTRRYVFST